MTVDATGQVSLLQQSQEATVTLDRSVQEGLRGRLRLLFDQQNTIIATTTI